MILSDRNILDRLGWDGFNIHPFCKEQLQPASYDLTLSNRAWKQKTRYLGYINVNNPPLIPNKIGDFFIFDELKLFPGDFILCSTRERIEVPLDLAARLEGKSSLGRLGLMVHVTAGYIDPNFKGYLTLELHHVGKIPLIITPGTRVSQISFYKLSSKVKRGYGHEELGSKYQDQEENPVPTF